MPGPRFERWGNVRRRGAVGPIGLALLTPALLAPLLLTSACSGPVPQAEEPAVAVVDETPLPAREELVAEVHEVIGDESAVERTHRVVDALHGEIALEHARRLSAELPVRTPFTVAERDAADWIVAELHAIGLPEEDVHVQAFGTKAMDGHARSELRALREDADQADTDREDADQEDAHQEDARQERVELSQNVVARLHGTGEGVIVVGAHYDSVRADGEGDNATGVGMLLETAWRLSGRELPYSVELVFFGAEHAGFAGAQVHLASMTPEQRDDVVLVVNASGLVEADELGFDVGLLDPEDGAMTRDALGATIRQTATDLDNGLRAFQHGIFAPGANLPFTYAGLRVLNLSAITGQIVERPSLADGDFHPGVVRRHEPAPAARGDEARGVREADEARGEVIVVGEDGDGQAWTFTREVVPGRKERALYVYGTFLETLLLGFPG